MKGIAQPYLCHDSCLFAYANFIALVIQTDNVKTLRQLYLGFAGNQG